ncbi:helix-turn-helix transcriptional regulator [Flavilitoribacter nigricans]|uniref:WYL domain-containing protein n=1 Tax=Flavilitoribacter nigricans (strain ATCC 23147 / DSM 23189 / NBRC 102662 / NCIMB 1420 / SS-2) TaxID=1122177 RepID=A0A2D0MWN2_FLAN2|nr:WYL domain-containing protein [Flavilitoribacter nigricans]PHN00645.1 WYL domain-containing protein [Flavilitoribacter nigricans DSM 23189 = NBRC 102662]
MALNKNALIRYRTIDKCLQNRHRRWTLNDLIDACSDALYEYEGKDAEVSKRTVQLDIQMMRSDKLGYNAPIVVYDRKFYTYEEEDFTITDVPLNESDMSILSESVEMLRQFKDFSLFSELGGVIQRLEDRIYTEKTHQPAIIHLDKNENLKGLEHLDTLYQSILKKIVLRITYQSFTARSSSVLPFHAYILKEFNNRWFVVGRKDGEERIFTLALDRIIQIIYDLSIPYRMENFDAAAFYRNTFGVTVMTDRQLISVELKVDRSNAPYVLTKPFHHSQQLLERYEDGSILISIYVHHNYELERLILGFGQSVEVLKPRVLRRRIQYILRNALQNYAPPETPSEED